ncbi:hypothetical protein MPSI1_000998 [Malassezia psittaci]|uniref:N-acetyltransferase domain-containing protein n=1 Tax=Malassezia psittaci TaxID=1821823 RepID=A0AAF0F9S1_9BASI|nr:hypothetical protein MPSI1_000998 [Malassezia psittaci]
MLINRTTVLVGENVVLVPYRKEHVPIYHEWLQDETMQQLTGSEPLTLSEEYEMQQSWHDDQDKLTFIILARDQKTSETTLGSLLESSPMAGDVNVFLHRDQENENGVEEEGQTSVNSAVGTTWGELEVMIGAPEYRRRGLAREALALLLYYITANPTPTPVQQDHEPSALPLKPDHLLVRIKADNMASISLFSSMGFSQRKFIAVFNEVELGVTDTKRLWCKKPDKVLEWLERT